jgi:hypothetical protein
MCACRPIGPIAAAVSGAVLLFAATALPAQAGAESEHVHIRFSAPKGCPDPTAFMRAVRQRTVRFHIASSLEQARTFAVTITRTSAAFSGRLETRASGSPSSERTVTGQTCDEVMMVLAFMTALAIDPSAAPQSQPAPRPASPSIPSPTTSAPADASNRGTAGSLAGASPQPDSPAQASSTIAAEPRAAKSPRANPSRSPALPPRDETPTLASAPELPEPSPGASPSPWIWSAGAHGMVSLGMSPTVGMGGLLFLEAAAPGDGVLGPVLRAGLFLSQSHAALASGAEAKFQWAAVLLEGCPMRLTLWQARVTLHACVAFHLGALRAQGRSLSQAEETTDVWADLGPVARLRLPVWGHLSLEAQGMLVVPLRRISYDVYTTGPSGAPTTVYEIPWVGALVGMGISYQFR